MRKVLIAVPCMDNLPAQFAHSLATLTSYGIPDIEISVWFNLGSLIYTSRDEIAKRALADEADLVMWFDSDMVFNPDTLKRMLDLIDQGHDFVTGVYYRRKPPFTPTIFKTMDIKLVEQSATWTGFDEIPDEPFEVAACGFGCVLMKTEIFVNVFGHFGFMFTPIGNVGEDIAFCWRARQVGYKLIADPSISLGHIGQAMYTKTYFENWKKAQAQLAAKSEEGKT